MHGHPDEIQPHRAAHHPKPGSSETPKPWPNSAGQTLLAKLPLPDASHTAETKPSSPVASGHCHPRTRIILR
ncbi:hypothetical protein N9250_03145 [bacterium]|nr:hypothetical protein [bacterium]